MIGCTDRGLAGVPRDLRQVEMHRLRRCTGCSECLGLLPDGSFFASDNTCQLGQAGYQASCINKELIGAIGAQAKLLRVPWPTAPSSPPPTSPPTT